MLTSREFNSQADKLTTKSPYQTPLLKAQIDFSLKYQNQPNLSAVSTCTKGFHAFVFQRSIELKNNLKTTSKVLIANALPILDTNNGKINN